MVGDLGEDGAEIGFGIDAAELGGFDQRQDAGGALAALVRPSEQPVLAPECNRTVILPISGRMSLFTILGIRCLGGVCAGLWVNSAQRAHSSISS
jgi:hypothetical protein